MAIPSAYDRLEQQFRKIAALDEASAMLGWDMQTMLPSNSGEGRAEQLAVLQSLGQELLLDRAVPEWLDVASADSGLNDWQRANVREMRRLYRHAAATDPVLLQALTRARMRCEMQWRQARANNDFKALLPAWQELLALLREQAAAKASAFGTTPYEALLDEYEPGLSEARLTQIFDDLAGYLPNLLGKILAQNAPAFTMPTGPFPIPAQEKLCADLLRQVGFDFTQGRLDISTHPFCGGVVDDIRLTTRYRTDDCWQSLMSLLHESGHAMYEAGLPRPWRYQPVGKARGMAMHESQSLFIEMQCARSAEFAEFLAPLLARAFPAQAAHFTAPQLQAWQKRVAPSLIRVEADEVTYPLHIILRFRLERAMIRGDLALADLPGAFNDGMRELLGITPPDDRMGCLQDVHWPSGAFGYFPTYSLGAIAAAQLFAAANQALGGNARAGLAVGDFKPLIGWLRANVHAKASLCDGEELLRQATGQGLELQHYKMHLEQRYLQ